MLMGLSESFRIALAAGSMGAKNMEVPPRGQMPAPKGIHAYAGLTPLARERLLTTNERTNDRRSVRSGSGWRTVRGDLPEG